MPTPKGSHQRLGLRGRVSWEVRTEHARMLLLTTTVEVY